MIWRCAPSGSATSNVTSVAGYRQPRRRSFRPSKPQPSEFAEFSNDEAWSYPQTAYIFIPFIFLAGFFVVFFAAFFFAGISPDLPLRSCRSQLTMSQIGSSIRSGAVRAAHGFIVDALRRNVVRRPAARLMFFVGRFSDASVAEGPFSLHPF